jgi:SAM-dependent methyltransferase
VTLPDQFALSRTERLGGRAAEHVEIVAPPPLDEGRRTRRLLRKVVRSSLGQRGVSKARSVARRLLADDFEAAGERTERVALALDELQRTVRAAAMTGVNDAALSGQIEANRINLELLKVEVRAVDRTLHELGMAFAPATGLDGAGVRFAELREQVNALSRRLRLLDESTTTQTPVPATPVPQPATEESATSADLPEPDYMARLFDYVAFERRFRGDPEHIVKVQSDRYLDLLSAHTPVVDIGCGRGELAEVLANHNVEVIGVEPDLGMAAEVRSRGVDVRTTDAVTFLESCADGSLGAVFSAHVAEHVTFHVLLRIVHLSLAKLKPGGIFVAETPNPASLIVLGNSFILDPTHVRPIHPALFSFVCETAGYRDVRLDFFSPATGYHIAPIDTEERLLTLNADLQRLNDVVFGPQEYVVIATKAAS